MESMLQEVTTRIAAHGDDFLAVTCDDELNAALGPFREDRPRRVCCPKCRRKLAYIAIDPYRPAVVGARVGARGRQLLKRQPGEGFVPRYTRIMRAKPESPKATEPRPEHMPAGLQLGGGTDHEEADRSQSTTACPPLYRRWPPDGQTIGEEADVHLPPQHRLRWVLTCPRLRCRRTYLVTNTGLLMLLVQAHAQGEDDIVLPPSCALSADWRPYLRPEAE